MTRRGTSNGNARGNTTDRERRRAYLLRTYRADVDMPPSMVELSTASPVWQGVPRGEGVLACRCYRCGCLLVDGTLTVDRIVPGCQGGTYRRNNIRPACGWCNPEEGGALRAKRKNTPPPLQESA